MLDLGYPKSVSFFFAPLCSNYQNNYDSRTRIISSPAELIESKNLPLLNDLNDINVFIDPDLRLFMGRRFLGGLNTSGSIFSFSIP
jgi:hypothetical protein